MCTAAAVGNTNRLRSYNFANADLSQAELSGRTPLHHAVLHGHISTAKFLIEHGAEAKSRDLLGMSAIDVASNSECRALLCEDKR